jgi:outer membrane protein, heavy metal efflux system
MTFLLRHRAAIALFLATGASPVAAQNTLGIDEAIALSVGDQPTIEAFGREAEASEQAAVAARTLPDPQLMVGVRDFPVTGDKAFSPTADNFTMYMIGVMREQVRRSKREAAASRLRAEALVSRAEATAQERRIQREVMVAWINAVEAEAKQRLLDRLIGDLRAGHELMVSMIPTGASTPSLALEMEAEIALAEAQQAEAVGAEARARAQMARWIGAAANRPLPSAVPALELPDVSSIDLADLGDHPAVEVAEAQEQAAQRLIDVARADRKSDISWSVSYGYRPDFGDLVTAQVTIPLQINRAGRQNRRIAEAAARADAARLRAQDTRRELASAYGAALADYKSAEAQLAIILNQAVPSLEASFEAAEARYGTGQGTLEQPLDIVRRYVEVTIRSIDEQAQRARAAAELIYLSQDAAR